MSWTMPAETALQERVWMAFPRPGTTLGSTEAEQLAGYQASSAVAHAVAEFEPVTMLVDPSVRGTAARHLGSHIETVEAPVGEFWMRDTGPSFVLDDRGDLGAVDWVFNGWGAREWADWPRDTGTATMVGNRAGAEVIASPLVNEGGGIQVDGAGTVLVTETVQLDPRRNPGLSRVEVEAELARTIGATKVVWLPRGLWRDTQRFGTNGHVDIVAALPSPGRLLLHEQSDPSHPDHRIVRELRQVLAEATDAAGSNLEIIDLPAPTQTRDREGWVDYSYINHLVVNGGVIACGFGDDVADARARDILGSVYPDREVVTVDARELFARGGGIHCITQQQPSAGPAR